MKDLIAYGGLHRLYFKIDIPPLLVIVKEIDKKFI